MRLVSLDLGTTTACVVQDPPRPLLTMVWDLSVQRGESNGMRFLRFRRHLAEILADGAGLVAYERPAVPLRNAPAAG